MKKVIILFISFVLVGCFSTKKRLKQNEKTQETLKNEKGPVFTEFFLTTVFSIPTKKVFTLNERKTFDIYIRNHGVKNLYAPKWFTMEHGKNSELYIELLEKNGDNYEVYKQKSRFVTTHRHYDTDGREVLSSKNGECLDYKNLELDTFLKIVDKGEYLAKIYIDLSNFGYFKILESEVFFEVIEN